MNNDDLTRRQVILLLAFAVVIGAILGLGSVQWGWFPVPSPDWLP